ncbi:MAG: glycosyl hydrolase-related protein [Phycisphaerae bacterium]|jgi:mannosylglycerate hydrolase
MQKNIKKRTGYIVSHTHWDREWRYPIWETRRMLIDFIDELIEVLESGKYTSFLLDGQVIPILDYLEFRPEMAGRIKSLVSFGKLQIGPWYTLPDEYPVDGEAIIRNLLWGIRKSEQIGGVFKAGYTSFGWGQTTQLPQIYAGFGMDTVMVGKHIGKHRAPKSEFIWCSPDGSELLATRFGSDGRANFYFNAHLSILFGLNHKSPFWEYKWEKGGVAYHRADTEKMEQDHFRLDVPVDWHPEMVTPELIETLWQTTDDSLMENDRLMMNGCDYTAAQSLLPEIVAKFNEIDSESNREWVQATMPEFIKLMKDKIDRSKLLVINGELRDGPAGPLTGNALSTRLYVKQLNKYAQNLLVRFAEPMAAFASMFGEDYPDSFIKRAWLYLLQSHPHDSINAVSQDKTALDVCHRLRQVIEISQTVADRAMKQLVKIIDMSQFGEEVVLLVVFNPLPYERSNIIEAWINVSDIRDKNEVWRAYRMPEGLQVFNADGKPLSTQNHGFTEQVYPVAQLHTRAFPYNCLRHKIFFETGKVPAGGYKIFSVKTIDQGRTEDTRWSDSIASTGSLLKSPDRLENEYLIVQMNPNGTFNLTDKLNNKTFYNLNYYEDRGEIGDYWFNEMPMFDQIHNSLGCSAVIWAEETGPLQATLASEIRMQLPQKAVKHQKRRSDERESLVIKTAVTLRAGVNYAEVNVEFENRHEDHYLRVMFPTGLGKATYADTGGHFIVDHRLIRPQGPTKTSVWPDMATLPQNNFVDVSDGTVGLAFLNNSLTEYEVLDNDERTAALSLLRAVQNWICTETRVGSNFPSQKGGQCLGYHSIRYAILPHTGNWQDANIPLAADFFNIPMVPVQTRKHKGTLAAKQASLFAIDNPAVRFSALKKAEDGDTFIVRLYNPTSQKQQANITFSAAVEKVWQTNLNEERNSPVNPADDGDIPIVLLPYKIVTIEVEMHLKGKQ